MAGGERLPIQDFDCRSKERSGRDFRLAKTAKSGARLLEHRLPIWDPLVREVPIMTKSAPPPPTDENANPYSTKSMAWSQWVQIVTKHDTSRHEIQNLHWSNRVFTSTLVP